MQLLQALGTTALLFRQGLELLAQALQLPFLLLQGLALARELRFRFIAGTAPFPEALL